MINVGNGALLVGLCWVASTAIPAFSSEPLETQCKEIGRVDFSTITDAPTQITETVPAEPSETLPGYCRVNGYVTPSVGFELLLPESWNGKLLHAGCGGLCGTTQAFDINSVLGCGEPLRRGYACIRTDMGHQGAGAAWAYNNLQQELDFGFRATHVTTVSGKAITERYYGSAPKRSYFTGCSQGGRQAMVAAQRFPWDFDGIVALDPAFNFTELLITDLWNELAVRDQDGKPIFREEDIRTLHAAVIAKCDLNDGVRDGLIGDPRECKFDPAELACTAGSSQGCLSSVQITSAQKIYNGPTTSTGQKIGKGGSPLGSETGFFGISRAQSSPLSNRGDPFRYMAFLPDPGPTWKATDLDFDRDYKRVGMMEALYASANPDLRKFKARGGKLILSQGWHDGGFPFAFNSIDYYETAEKTLGGRAPTQEFFRLFMIPGREHCAGGNGAWAIDHLSYLEDWVEKDQAPDIIIGHHPKAANNWMVRLPLAAQDIQFSRPVYPYPLKTKYRGKGDVSKLSSFAPVKP